MSKIFRFIAGSILIPVLLCSCAKREMTQEDIEDIVKIVDKYNQAQLVNNTAAMLDHANEILAAADKFKCNNDSKNAKCLGLIRRGNAYAFLNRYEDAVNDFDAAIKEAPYFSTELVGYYHKIFALTACKRHDEADATARKALKLLDHIEEDLICKDDKEKRNIFLNYRKMVIIWWGISLSKRKKYAEKEKLFADFLSRFKNEKDFREAVEDAAVFYNDMAELYHALKNTEKELYFLHKSLSTDDDSIVFTGTHLRLIGYAIRDKNYVKALKICDQALNIKSSRMNLDLRQRNQEMLLSAKIKIFQLMNKPEEAKKISSQNKINLSSDLKDRLDWLLFDF